MGKNEKVILDLTFKRLLSIWWSMAWRSVAWRSVAWTLLAALVLGALMGGIAYLLGRPELVRTFLEPLVCVASLFISIWVMKTALLKKRKEFTIILLKNSG